MVTRLSEGECMSTYRRTTIHVVYRHCARRARIACIATFFLVQFQISRRNHVGATWWLKSDSAIRVPKATFMVAERRVILDQVG